MNHKECFTRGLDFYTLDGVEVVLADLNNPKFDCLDAIDDDGSIGAYRLDEIDFKIDKTDLKKEIYSSYDNSQGCGDDIVLEFVTNPENSQKLLYAFAHKESYESDLYERELLITTNKYYDWTSARARFVENVARNLGNKQSRLAEWETICKDYDGFNHYCDNADFNELWNEILERREQIAE